MPRLPRVTRRKRAPRRARRDSPARGGRREVLGEAAAEERLGLLLVGGGAVEPREVAEAVAAVGEEDGVVAEGAAEAGEEGRLDGAVAVVGEDGDRRRAARRARPVREARGEGLALLGGEGQPLLDVVAHDLLLDGVAAAAQDADLGGGAVAGADQDAGGLDAERLERRDQLAAGGVVADDARAAAAGRRGRRRWPPRSPRRPAPGARPRSERMRTGASRLIRFGVPVMNRSATRSTTIATGRPAMPSTSDSSRSDEGSELTMRAGASVAGTAG